MLFTVRLYKYGIGVHAIYCQNIQIWNWCACYLLSHYSNMELVYMLFTVRIYKYGIGGTCYLLSDYSNMELVCMLFTVRLFKYGIGVHAIYCQNIQIWNWCACYLLSDY